MSFHQALDLILELDEAAVGCTRDILRQRDCLDQLSEIPWVVPTFVVIEGEDIVAEFYSPSRGEELSNETSRLVLNLHTLGGNEVCKSVLDIEPCPAVYPPLPALSPEWPFATEVVQEVLAASISE
ncbi:hypothetical protein Tco_0828621 [Tanacetum coccineum]